MKLIVVFAFSAAISACGSSDSSPSALKAGPADLRFVGSTVEMLLPPSSAPVTVAAGTAFKITCGTQGFRARYRYGNSGQSPAPAFKNASGIVGGGTYQFDQAAIAPGATRWAHASFGQVAVANVETKLSIRLDAPGVGVVAEGSETNNTWVAKVVRVCP